MDTNQILQLLGDPGVYKAGSVNSLSYDGTVGWVNATTLTIINLPVGVVLTSDAVLGVIEYLADNRLHVRSFTSNRLTGRYRFAWAAPNLTIISMDPTATVALTNGSIFTVLYAGPDRNIDLERVVGEHGEPPANAFGLKVLVEALNNPAAAAVDNGDLVRPRASLRGAIFTSAYHENQTVTVDSRIERHDYPVSVYGTQVGGRASLVRPAGGDLVGADGDFVRTLMTRAGAPVAGAYHQQDNETMEARIEEHDVAASLFAWQVGGRAYTSIPAAVSLNDDFARMLVSLRGAPVTAAHHDNQATFVEDRIERHDYPTGEYGRQVGGYASAALPTAVNANGDFSRFWSTTRGAVVTGSYLQSGTTSMEDRIEQNHAAVSAYGYAVGGHAYTDLPADVHADDFTQILLSLRGGVVGASRQTSESTFRENRIERHDYAADEYGYLGMNRASLGIPAAVNDGDAVRSRADLTGSLAAFLTQALTRASEVTTFERPPDAIANPAAARAVGVATATTLTAASTPCVSVTVYNPNAAVMGVGGATINNTNCVLIPANGFYTMEIDDLVKVYVYLAAGGTVVFTYFTRA